MATMVEVKCKTCKEPFMARVADRKRGWGKYCSKSCKAIKQEQRTGARASFYEREREREDRDIDHAIDAMYAVE